MRAVREGGQNRLDVMRVRSRHVDGASVEERREIRQGLRADLAGQALRRGGDRVGHAHQIDAGIGLEVERVQASDEARADDADPHGRFIPRCGRRPRR